MATAAFLGESGFSKLKVAECDDSITALGAARRLNRHDQASPESLAGVLSEVAAELRAIRRALEARGQQHGLHS